MLRFFHYRHLPPKLREISQPFCAMARFIIDTLPGRTTSPPPPPPLPFLPPGEVWILSHPSFPRPRRLAQAARSQGLRRRGPRYEHGRGFRDSSIWLGSGNYDTIGFEQQGVDFEHA